MALMGCASPSVPETFTETNRLPKIYPDYTDVTVPVNIAPLTFQLDEAADGMIARYAVGDDEIVCADKAQPETDDWRRLAEKAKGFDFPVPFRVLPPPGSTRYNLRQNYRQWQTASACQCSVCGKWHNGHYN